MTQQHYIDLRRARDAAHPSAAGPSALQPASPGGAAASPLKGPAAKPPRGGFLGNQAGGLAFGGGAGGGDESPVAAHRLEIQLHRQERQIAEQAAKIDAQVRAAFVWWLWLLHLHAPTTSATQSLKPTPGTSNSPNAPLHPQTAQMRSLTADLATARNASREAQARAEAAIRAADARAAASEARLSSLEAAAAAAKLEAAAARTGAESASEREAGLVAEVARLKAELAGAEAERARAEAAAKAAESGSQKDRTKIQVRERGMYAVGSLGLAIWGWPSENPRSSQPQQYICNNNIYATRTPKPRNKTSRPTSPPPRTSSRL